MRVETIGDATRRGCTAIYALCEHPSGEPRYVGKTIQYLHERHKAHIRNAKRGSSLPVHCWIRKQIEAGSRLAIKLLEYVPEGQDWAAREAYWIDRVKASGRSLNLTGGGEGLAGHSFSAAHKAKIAAALRTGDHRNCIACGVEFWRKAHEIAKGHDKFCSHACANKHNKGGWACRKKS